MPAPKEKALDLLGMLPDKIDELLASEGLPAYRAGQILDWLYQKDARSLGKMTNLSKSVRESLAAKYRISDLRRVKVKLSTRDSSKKFLFSLRDGAKIETVLMREGGRDTVCVSTQVGCAFGCAFCATGVGGFERDLTAGEIVDQVRRAKFDEDAGRLTNVVMMGMGEPLANYEACAKAVRIVQHDKCLGLGKRRVTISTAGYAPGITQLAEDNLPVKLAISLHATDDKTRSRLMPINRKYPMKKLLEALRPLAGKTQTPLTIEYMLIDGVNDSLRQARELARICRSLSAKVNLLSLNPSPSGKFSPTPRQQVLRFQTALREADVLAFIRKSRGLDIDAACGQLATPTSRRPASRR